MVRDDPDGNIRIIILMVGYACDLTDLAAQRLHGIHIKNGIHVLYHHCQTFQSHAGVDILLLQFGIISFSVIIKLGKHVVPDFHIAVAVTAHRTVRLSAAVLFTSVIIDLGTGAAGTGAVLPEIVRLAEAENALRRNADLLIPDLKRLLILLIDRRIEPVLRESHHFG